MTHTPLRVLSLGAGVQSSTVLLLALHGELDPLDAAIFADTGWEPRAVYEHLDRLRAECDRAGLPLHVVSAGNIRDTERQKAFYDAPYYLRNPDGSDGMARRQCTHQLKLLPIRRKVRELMAERDIPARPGAVEQWIGISLDEYQRVKDPDVRFISHRYPLIERRWTRHDCQLHLDRAGWNAPRSACIGCPYHTNTEWRGLAPDEFADAVAFEQEIQASEAGLRGTPFLHAARVPLDQVDLTTAEDRGQLTFGDECEGMCGV
jgi:hypothetical protein